MPLMASPITTAAPARASAMCLERPFLSLNASHSAAKDAVTAMPIDAETSHGAYLIIGTMVIAAMPE